MTDKVRNYDVFEFGCVPKREIVKPNPHIYTEKQNTIITTADSLRDCKKKCDLNSFYRGSKIMDCNSVMYNESNGECRLYDNDLITFPVNINDNRKCHYSFDDRSHLTL